MIKNISELGFLNVNFLPGHSKLSSVGGHQPGQPTMSGSPPSTISPASGKLGFFKQFPAYK